MGLSPPSVQPNRTNGGADGRAFWWRPAGATDTLGMVVLEASARPFHVAINTSFLHTQRPSENWEESAALLQSAVMANEHHGKQIAESLSMDHQKLLQRLAELGFSTVKTRATAKPTDGRRRPPSACAMPSRVLQHHLIDANEPMSAIPRMALPFSHRTSSPQRTPAHVRARARRGLDSKRLGASQSLPALQPSPFSTSNSGWAEVKRQAIAASNLAGFEKHQRPLQRGTATVPSLMQASLSCAAACDHTSQSAAGCLRTSSSRPSTAACSHGSSPDVSRASSPLPRSRPPSPGLELQMSSFVTTSSKLLSTRAPHLSHVACYHGRHMLDLSAAFTTSVR